MSWLAGLGGAALQGAAGIGGAFLGQSFNKDMQKRAYRLNRRTIQNTAQWQVQGLRDAGLNPVLAVKQPGATGFSGMGSGANVGRLDMAQAASSVVQMGVLRAQ